MKEKLEVIRELTKAEYLTYSENQPVIGLKPKDFNKASALLDSLIAELDSDELVARVATNDDFSCAVLDAAPNWPNIRPEHIREVAQAAINAIKNGIL